MKVDYYKGYCIVLINNTYYSAAGAAFLSINEAHQYIDGLTSKLNSFNRWSK